jgi:iron complex transport system ATP-binding protein
MATMKNIIEVRNLSFAFNGQQVLSSVSLDIRPGELTVLLGQNGSGKSTLLRLMAGILAYQEGSVKVDGQQVSRLTYRQRARIMAFLPQKHKAVFPFTVEEVVLTGRAAHVAYVPSRQDLEVAQEAIRTAGVEHLKHRYYTELSGGEQQLVMIARTLAQQPRIILLDEPVSHLDYNNQLRILGLLKKLAGKGITVVAVIHDPNLAFIFGQRFIYIHGRQAHPVGEGKAWEHALVRDIFHEDMQTLEHEGLQLFVPRLS